MNTKKILGAALLALVGATAQATVSTTTVGNTITYTENFNGASSFSAGFVEGGSDDYLRLRAIVGPTDSFYSFSSAVAIESLAISFWYSTLTLGQSASWSLAGSSGILPNTPNPSIFDNYVLNNPGVGGSNADKKVEASWSNLAAGTYTLAFNSGLGGLKVDDVNIAVTAVPEPETYAMMLAGLGLMGTIARRRKAKQA